MLPKNLLLSIFLCTIAANVAKAETVTEYFLDTVDSGEGSWPCLFYELNYNTDISVAEKAKWYSQDEDESYWREGIGPFSIDANKFLVTQWQSTVHPILIRRHFYLTAEDLTKIEAGTVTLVYSYDENPKIWLNSTLLVSTTGWNDNNYASLRFTSARKKLLVEGDNVLCVSLQKGEGGGHIDYGLSVTYNPMHDGITSPSISPEGSESSQDSKFKIQESIYDLSGQRVNSQFIIHNSQFKKGIFVKQNKKVILK